MNLYILYQKTKKLEYGQLSTNNENKMERQFPSPIPKLATFGDWFWSHAVAQNSLEKLTLITIGFQFQRLMFHCTIESRGKYSTQTSIVCKRSKITNYEQQWRRNWRNPSFLSFGNNESGLSHYLKSSTKYHF